MICPNCQTPNTEGSKFCIKCGNNIQIQQDTNNNMKVSIKDYIFIIIAVILKPFTAFKEELDKFNNIKNSAILSLIVAAISTIVSLIKTMLNVIIVKDYSWSGDYTTTWVWENLKDINYFQVIGKNFLIYLGIIAAIAGVYYIASLIIKKELNFSRMLGIAAVSIVPMLICSLIVSPLLGLIYAPLSTAVSLIGGVYSIMIMYETINNEIMLEKDMKFYFNLVCLSILAIAAYYVYMKFFMVSASGLDSILDMFS